MRDKDELDLMLDSALTTYADPGADSGLEERVLAAVAAARGARERAAVAVRPKRRWIPWAMAVPVTAGLLLLWLTTARIKHVPSIQQQAYHSDRAQPPSLTGTTAMPQPTTGRRLHPAGAKAPTKLAADTARLKPCPVTRLGEEGASTLLTKSCADAEPNRSATTMAKAGPLPRLDVFPAPRPLTAQEQALVGVATSASSLPRAALADAAKDSDLPLDIAALHITPLSPSDEGKH